MLMFATLLSILHVTVPFGFHAFRIPNGILILFSIWPFEEWFLVHHKLQSCVCVNRFDMLPPRIFCSVISLYAFIFSFRFHLFLGEKEIYSFGKWKKIESETNASKNFKNVCRLKRRNGNGKKLLFEDVNYTSN